jgi:putative spermidine/putrescine transport system ATP-binding protein
LTGGILAVAPDDVRPDEDRSDHARREPLRLVQVSKRYGDVDALLPTTIEIGSGSLTALLGPSGCGKTTTLRIIAGLEHPDQGRVFIGARDVTDLAPNKRGLGMVFQNYSLFPHLSVFENVAFGLRMRKVPEDRVRTKVV